MEQRRDRPSVESYEFVIPVEPITKKNSQVIARVNGRLMILPSTKYREYEKSTEPFIPPMHIDYKCNVKAVYYRSTHRRVDLCNLHEALCDVLVKWGCIDDDNVNIVYSMDGSYVDYDKENPRTEVVIERLEDGQEKRDYTDEESC